MRPAHPPLSLSHPVCVSVQSTGVCVCGVSHSPIPGETAGPFSLPLSLLRALLSLLSRSTRTRRDTTQRKPPTHPTHPPLTLAHTPTGGGKKEGAGRRVSRRPSQTHHTLPKMQQPNTTPTHLLSKTEAARVPRPRCPSYQGARTHKPAHHTHPTHANARKHSPPPTPALQRQEKSSPSFLYGNRLSRSPSFLPRSSFLTRPAWGRRTSR